MNEEGRMPSITVQSDLALERGGSDNITVLAGTARVKPGRAPT